MNNARIWGHWVMAISIGLAAWSLAQVVRAAAPAQQSRWSIVAITPPYAQGGFTALDINNRGEVVGYGTVSDPTQGTAFHALVWDNGTVIDLGRSPSGYPISTARAINDRGTVLAADGLGVQYTWSNAVWTRLDVPGFANVINRVGTIGGSYTTPSGWAHGFIYRDGVFTDVGTLGGGYSDVTDLNDKGLAVGKSLLPSNFEYHPYLYDGGAMKDLGTFGGRFGTALDVNNHGVIVGAASDAANVMHAFVYEGGAIRQLFPGETTNSQAVAINDHGTIIGWGQGISNSFIYDNGMVTMIEQIPEVKAGGWSWMVPKGINDRGWVTGYGRKGAAFNDVAFVLMPK